MIHRYNVHSSRYSVHSNKQVLHFTSAKYHFGYVRDVGQKKTQIPMRWIESRSNKKLGPKSPFPEPTRKLSPPFRLQRKSERADVARGEA